MSDLSKAKRRIQKCLVNQDPYLDISYCGITDLGELPELFDCTHLESLNLEGNKISDISVLGGLSGLENLNLEDNNISDISVLGRLSELENLNLWNNKISDISVLGGLSGLQELSLSSNNISDISVLGGLSGLEKLYLWNNNISDISVLGGLSGLQELNLGDNKISDISVLGGLSELEKLDLGNNNISDISVLGGLSGLQELNLGDNNISDISVLGGLSGLEKLYLGNNNISDISVLGGLSGLEKLYLWNNNISDISVLGGLSGLQELSLSSNNISDISVLGGLSGLQELDLRDNNISDISVLGGLSGLQELNLGDNKISELPTWIAELKMEITLREYGGGLNLYNNPLKTPPPEIVKQGKEAMRRYFKERERADVEQVELLEAKVLLLGEGNTGKTSLRLKLENEKNPLPGEADRTRGIDIYHHKFPIKDKTDKAFISHIWDFGGQDVLYQVHRFFLSDDALYILVTDSRFDQGNKFEEWLQTIEIFTSKKERNQIILLQNLKFGGTPANIDIAEFKRHYCIVGSRVHEVDLNLSTDEQVSQFRGFRQVIEHRLQELPHVKKPILSHWLAVRKRLEKKLKQGTHLIPLSEYKEICQTCKVDDPEVQKDLLRYLHNLGIVLWYEKHSATRQRVILNPEWVTTALYRIIESKNIRDKNGKLELADMEELWSGAIYQDYHNELIEILKIFRLAYERKEKDEYIVPSLVNTDIPKKYENWDREGTSQGSWVIRYHYPRLMPRGLVNQLAAELCRYIESDFDDVWAFGVGFTIKETKTKAQAKVQEDRNQKQIEVRATGAARLVLMQGIVKAMEDIHETYKGLDFDMEIPCICEECAKKTDDKKTYYKYYKHIMTEVDDNRDDIYCRNLRTTLKIKPILLNSGFDLPHSLGRLLGEEGEGESLKSMVRGGFDVMGNKIDKVGNKVDKVQSTLDRHFENLMSLKGNERLNQEEIISAVQEISDQQKEAIFKELNNTIIAAFEVYQGNMTEKLNSIYENLQKSNDLEMKIKASIPLLNILGLDISVEHGFDIKSWSQKMYEKYELKLFELLGYL